MYIFLRKQKAEKLKD